MANKFSGWKMFNRNVRLANSVLYPEWRKETINSQDVFAQERDADGDILRAYGTVTITDWASGYAKWCLYRDTDVSAGTSGLYENVGTNTSSNFDLIAWSSWSGSPTWGLDSAYSIDQTIDVDSGAMALTDSTTWALATLDLTKDGAGSWNVLDISIDAALTGNAIALDMNLGIAAEAIFIDAGAWARTGSDVLVTDNSTWNHSVVNIDKSWSGASIWLDYQETYNGSSASFVVKATLDNADGIDTTVLQAVRWTWIRTAPVIDINDDSTWSAQIIDVDLTGIYTGNVFDFASAAAATWNVINMNLDNAVAMTWIHVEWSWVRTQPMVEVITDSTSSASLIDLSVDGAITGQAALDIDMNAWLAANAIYIDAGAGTRTANLLEFKDDWDGNVDTIAVVAANTWSGSVLDIDITWIRTGNIVDVVCSAAATWNVINVDMDASVAGKAIFLDAGGGTRTDDLVEITFDGDGQVPCFDINVSNTWAWGTSDVFDIDVSSVFTWSVIDIVYSAAATWDAIVVDLTSAVAAKALILTWAWARTDDFIEINDGSTSNSHTFDINVSGVTTWNIMDINYSAAATGNAINIATWSNLAWNAVAITTAWARTAPVILVTWGWTDAWTDDHIIDINQDGLLDSNIIDITYWTAASTWNAIDLNMGTNVAGMAIAINTAGTWVSWEWNAINAVWTWNLVAGADLVRLESTGSISSTSNILAIEQNTWAGTTWANGLYINCTWTNVEAIKVDAGTVTLDETLTVSWTTSLDAAVIYWGTETIAAGWTTTALDLTKTVHDIDSDAGGDIFTLANGTVWQIQICVLKSATWVATITPATFLGWTSVTLNAAWDTVMFVYQATLGWSIIGGNSYAVV